MNESHTKSPVVSPVIWRKVEGYWQALAVMSVVGTIHHKNNKFNWNARTMWTGPNHINPHGSCDTLDEAQSLVVEALLKTKTIPI